jgi:hypothetical protein
LNFRNKKQACFVIFIAESKHALHFHCRKQCRKQECCAFTHQKEICFAFPTQKASMLCISTAEKTCFAFPPQKTNMLCITQQKTSMLCISTAENKHALLFYFRKQACLAFTQQKTSKL